MAFRLRVNAREHLVDAPEDMPLLWVLREKLGLKGPKFGCGIGACGACTVHIDGEAVRSCVTPVGGVGSARITTIEGLAGRPGEAGSDGAKGDRLHPLQAAWIEEDVAQCGYCQAGQIMAAAAYLKANPNPSDEDIDAGITNLCRCGTYTRLRAAIHRAAREMRDAG